MVVTHSSSSPHHEHDVKLLLDWRAPGRPFKKRGREFYLSVILLTFFIEFILFLVSQYELMLVVLAVVFLGIVLSVVPPKDFYYRVSTEGITMEDHFYLWNELYDFYFKKIGGMDTLFIRTHALLPGELHIPLGKMSSDEVRKALVRFLPYRELVRPTFMEKSADWLTRTFPLEKPQK